LKRDDGLCDDTLKNDDTFDFKLMLSTTYDCDNLSCPAEELADRKTCNGKSGGMVIMIDGVVMGKDSVMLPSLPLGESEVLMQISQG
jgi:hypothetical protein